MSLKNYQDISIVKKVKETDIRLTIEYYEPKLTEKLDKKIKECVNEIAKIIETSLKA